MSDSRYTSAMERVVEGLSRLPGIGRRSAHRMAFHLLKQPADQVQDLILAIDALRQTAVQCSQCCHISDTSPCAFCSDPHRDPSQILVVEEPRDLVQIETAGTYRGRYHVLMGRLAPLDGIMPGDLTFDLLVRRVRDARDAGQPIREIILGTSPTMEGDGTALHLIDALSGLPVTITRLARGLPTGYSLEQASKAVLVEAIAGRHVMP